MYNKFIEYLVTNPFFYKLNGFVIVRSVIKPEKIENLRDHILNLYTSNSIDDRILPPNIFLSSPLLRKSLFYPKVVHILKKIFGDTYSIVGNFHVLRNSFGPWHVDSGSEAGQPYLFSKKYGLAKCGIFLQEHTQDFGGSINMRLFSHLFVYNRFPLPIRYIFIKIYLLIRQLLEHRVKLKAGDFIAFDSRLEHESAFPKNVKISNTKEGYLEQDHKNSKYTIYWDSSNLWSQDTYTKNSIRRSFMDEYIEQPRQKNRITFSDYLSRRFPEDYPPDFVKHAQENNVEIASLSGKTLERMKRHYQAVMNEYNIGEE